MSTLAKIAVGYGIEPIEFATLVGIPHLDPHQELGPEQTAVVIGIADNSEFFGGPSTRGRHRLFH